MDVRSEVRTGVSVYTLSADALHWVTGEHGEVSSCIGGEVLLFLYSQQSSIRPFL